jgi:hypothetical protein
MQFNKRGLIFSSAEEFYGASGPIILKNVDNTRRRANKYRKRFPKAFFIGKQTNALVSICLLIHAPIGVILEHLRCPENVGFCYSMQIKIILQEEMKP